MEHSSPLAAMQPSPAIFGHCFPPDKPSAPFQRCPRSFGPNSFNFRELSAKGSSPTVSLAADLSQNFHIDQSPQLATPRRSLFSSTKLAQEACEQATSTPYIPPSSPAPENMDLMDVSPLPHKLPWTHCQQDSAADSPTAELFAKRPHQIYVPSPLQDSPIDPYACNRASLDLPGRKKASFTRPSFVKRAQNFSSRPTPLRQIPDLEISPNSKCKTPASPSLSEMFEDGSPVREMPIQTPGSPIKFVGNPRRNGSPVPRRRSPNPFARPRKQTRRSVSMFESSHCIDREDDSGYFSGCQDFDMDSSPSLRLPHFIPEDYDDQLPRIDQTTMIDILNGKYDDHYDDIRIVDCRFPFEYEGGHINGAVNHNAESLAMELFGDEPRGSTALILHCEFSKFRAPEMAQFIRSRDRAFNIHAYPKLSYPEMYILDGGYSAFFSEYRDLCFPQSYIKMGDKNHEFACERGLGQLKNRSKLARASTFTFGQRQRFSVPMDKSRFRNDDSPTKNCRNPRTLDAVPECSDRNGRMASF